MRDTEARAEVAEATASSFFEDVAGGTCCSLETCAFRSCTFVEVITIEYGGGSSNLSSLGGSMVTDVRIGIDVP